MATNSGPVNLAYAIVALAVVVIVITTVALPVVNSMQSSAFSAENANTGQRYNMADSVTGTITLKTEDSKTTINGTAITALPAASPFIYFVTDQFEIILYDTQYWTLYLYGAADSSIYVNSSATRYFEISDNTLYIKNTDPSLDTTVPFTYILEYSASGNYGCWYVNPNTGKVLDTTLAEITLYVDSDSIVYLVSMDPTTYKAYTIASGTIDDINYDSTYYNNAAVTPSSDITMTYQPTTDGFSNAVTEISWPNNIFKVQYIIAPVDYTILGDATGYNLIGIIPVLLILVPIMMAVGLLRGRS